VNLQPEQLARRLLVLLGLLTLLCYLPATRHNFINVDDPLYILENPHVTTGLTWSNIAWAFDAGYAGNWHPLTWISHMFDCQVFGLNPAGHHLTNVLLHTANTLLLFLWLRMATGRLWPSVFVAAFFGWHPLHVESVAWASERKDVLSTFFFLLSLMAYTRYVLLSKLSRSAGPKSKVSQPEQQTGVAARSSSRITHHASFCYFLTLVLFVLGLMSKPMLVTFPFVLLLLDYWPFQRFAFPRPPLRLVVEKLPFLALSLIASIVTFVVQNAWGAVSSLQSRPMPLRIENSLQAYTQYLFKTFWPEHLASIYAYSQNPNLAAVVGSGLLLLVLSAVALAGARRSPWLFTGWFWFVGTLVPVIGLVQVGGQGMADRYMYIPSIGLFTAIVWLLDAWVQHSPNDYALSRLRPVLSAVALLALVACLARTSFQLKYWQNSELLFRHSLAAAPLNYCAFGKSLDDLGRKDEALAAYSEALRLDPHLEEARYNLATLLAGRGQYQEAITNFELAIKDNPRHAAAHHNLASALLKVGRLAEAHEQMVRAVDLKPDDPAMHCSLGTIFLTESNFDSAASQFSQALRLKPDYADAHRNLGFALLNQGKTNDALVQFSEAVRLAPDNPDARFNLGLALLEQNRPADAEAEFSAGLRLRPDETRFHYRLAVALVRQERTNDAIVQYREALRLTPNFPEARNELAALLAGDAEKAH
jgi:Flp pilus assembly protein TadD